MISNIPRLVPNWQQPIVIGRHAFGDQYKATDIRFQGKGSLELVFKPENGQQQNHLVYHNTTDNGGVFMGMYNLKDSIH